MDIRFDGKVVAVTGAGGGIGSAMAHAFAESGASVAVCDIKGAEAAASGIEAKGGRAAAFHLDVTDKANIEDVLRAIEARFGGVDVWINNAGINVGPDQRFPVDQFSDKWWEAIINVDLNGVYNCSKRVVPYLAKRRGNLLNISSVTGVVPLRNQCAFTAAKAGVINFSKAMALELAESGIRVNVIAPGTVGIAKTRQLWTTPGGMEGLLAHIPQHRQAEPGEIADAAVFLASEHASYITGAVLNIDGGWMCGYARDF